MNENGIPVSFISEKFKRTIDETIKDITSIDKSLTKIYKLQKSEAKEEDKERRKKDQQRKREAQREKRKKADDNTLKKIVKKKEGKEVKKGLFDTIKDALAPFMGIIGSIGSTIAGALGGIGLGGILASAMAALAPILIAALGGIAIWAAWQARHEIGKMMGGRGETAGEQFQNFTDDNRSWASEMITGVKISDARRLMNETQHTLSDEATEAVNASRSAEASGSGKTEEEKKELREKAESAGKKYTEHRDLADRVIKRDNMMGQLERIQKDLAMKDKDVPWHKHLGDVKKWRAHLEKKKKEIETNVTASNDIITKNADKFKELGIDAEILANQFTNEEGNLDFETGQSFEVRSDSTTGAVIQSGAVTDTNFLNPQGLQSGGFVVPGKGHGDQFYTRVPQGSFVLNRKAVAAGQAMGMFQQGGAPPMQDVVLEPGEIVFGPGQWEDKGIDKLNTDHKRFQTGGAVPIATDHIKKDESLSSLTKGQKDWIREDGKSVRSNTPWSEVDGTTIIHAYRDSVSKPTIGGGSTYYDNISHGKDPVSMGDTVTKSKSNNVTKSKSNNVLKSKSNNVTKSKSNNVLNVNINALNESKAPTSKHSTKKEEGGMWNGVKKFLGFQEGGTVPGQDVVLEPGEMVFPQATPELVALNQGHKRFQTGGLVQANHPDTGEGWSVGKDSYGRPSVFAKPAGEALLKAIKASKGQVKTSDITSSTRSPAKNKAVGGATQSNHLYGNAVDIHGTSKTWLKQNGEKYGWKNLVYAGGHDGHFDFKGGGGLVPGDGKETTAESPIKPSGSSIFETKPNAGQGLGDMLSIGGVGSFTSTFLSEIGTFLKEQISGEGSKSISPSSSVESSGSSLVDQSHEAQETSDSAPVVVDLGGSDTQGTAVSSGSLHTLPPELPDGPSSAAAADYYFNVNLCQ